MTKIRVYPSKSTLEEIKNIIKYNSIDYRDIMTKLLLIDKPINYEMFGNTTCLYYESKISFYTKEGKYVDPNKVTLVNSNLDLQFFVEVEDNDDE